MVPIDSDKPGLGRKMTLSEQDLADREQYSYIRFFKNWMGSSSCNGLPNIENASSVLRKAYWAALVLAGTALTLQSIVSLVTNYFDFPVTISVNVTFANTLPFPAITVCNTNIVRHSRIDMARAELEPILPYTFGSNDTTHLRTSQGRSELRSEFYTVYSELEEDIRQQMGHQKETFFIDCEFDGDNCDHNNFTEMNNVHYGNCFTFNPQEQERFVHRTGPTHGLTLEMYIEQDEYVAELTEIAGVVVTIHQPEVMPFPEDEGYLISPDKATYLGMSLMEITRKPSPYPSKCWSLTNEAAGLNSIYSELYNVSYSVLACQKTCYQAHVVERCHCGDPLIPLEGRAITSLYPNATDEVPPCSSDTQIECELKIKEQYSADLLQCNCSVPCQEDLYVLTPSSGIWPGDKFADIYYSELVERYPHFATIIDARVDGSNPATHLVKLVVFFEEFNYQKISEVAAYPQETMLADVGGAIGFYLGLSIIAIFEFFELIFDCVRVGVLRCMKSPQGIGNKKMAVAPFR